MVTALQWLAAHLPIFGVVAFSLASVWSLFHLFAANAKHPTDLFWAPATLVELVTAWLVYSCVGLTRKVLLSNITIQDRKFYRVMLALNLLLMVPTLGASVWANALEFQSWWLGSLFPVASVACAVAVAIPDAVRKREKQREQDKQKQKSQEATESKSTKRPIAFVCKSCKRKFSTVQARSAHMRFCPANLSNSNGKEPAREREEQPS